MPRNLLAPLIVFLCGVALSGIAYLSIDAAERESQKASFEALAARTVQETRLLMARPAYGLGGARGVAAASEDGVLDIGALAAYLGARDLATEFPGVFGFGLILPVKRGEEAAFEARMHAQGDAAFSIRGDGDRDSRYVVTAIEPRSTNAASIGSDIGADPTQWEAMDRLLRLRTPQITAPTALVQDPLARPGALLMTPLFASRKAVPTGPDDAVVGVLFAALVYQDLIDASSEEASPLIRMRVSDVGGPAPVVVHDSNPLALSTVDPLSHEFRFEHFGRPFAIEVAATPGFIAIHPVGDARLLLVLGAVLSALVALVVAQQQRVRDRATALAASMTVDLERLAAVARLTGNAVSITDPHGRITWVNRAFTTVTGYTLEEVLARKPGSFLQTELTDPAEVARIRAAITRRENCTARLLNRSKDGVDYWIDLEIQPMFRADGTLTGFIGLQTDVTARLAAEAALRASEALLDRTGEVSGTGGWRLDLATGALAWTRITHLIHGVPPGYVPDVANAIQFYAPEARPVIATAVEEAIATGRGWDLELPFIDYSGRRLWVRAVGQVARDDAGKPVGLNGSFTDITAAVEQRQALEAERERLAMIIEGTGAGTWEWNMQTGESRFNARFAEIVGHSLDEMGAVTIETWAELTHPQDLEQSREALRRHLAGIDDFCNYEARMRHKDGHWVWVLSRGRLMSRTPEGKPEWMFGTHLDVTARKEAELLVSESRALLFTTLHSIGDAVLTADVEGRVTWMNPVAEMLTGWSAEDASGRVAAEVLDLAIEGREGRAPCPVSACLVEGRKVGLAGNTLLTAKTGHRYAVEDSASPLRDGAGPIQGVVMVFRDVSEQAALAREMNFRATHDLLTGLLNRAEFESTLQEALVQAKASDRPGALMFLDLDHFKVINDSCGHAAGDQVLVQIAGLLGAAVRARDSVARIGGDEFAILLERCPLDRAQSIAQKIVDAVDHYRYASGDGRRFRVGISIGLVPIDSRWINLPQLVQGADAACLTAKSEGRGRVVVDEGVLELSSRVHRTIKWGPLIEQALDEDLFELFAQRVVPLEPEEQPMLRCEVLLRMRDDNGELIGPGEFIPAAERYQLASRIDRWVLRHVLAQLAPVPVDRIGKVAINISGQSIGDRAFHAFALEQIQRSGIAARALCIEITETALVTNFADAARFIDQLRNLGVQVALDDFGAGSSSFGYLKSLRVDILKIDGQFVRGLVGGDLEAVAVRSFVDVAKVLGIDTVAEQIENDAIAHRLHALGVDYGQGFHFHRPEPFRNLLAGLAAETAPRAPSNLVAFGSRRPRPA